MLLLLIFAKADQETLSSVQKSQLRKYVDAIIKEFA